MCRWRVSFDESNINVLAPNKAMRNFAQKLDANIVQFVLATNIQIMVYFYYER